MPAAPWRPGDMRPQAATCPRNPGKYDVGRTEQVVEMSGYRGPVGAAEGDGTSVLLLMLRKVCRLC